jgi:hypothetical protein
VDQAQENIVTERYDVAETAAAQAENQLGNQLSHWIIFAGVVGAIAVGDTLFILYVHADRERDLGTGPSCRASPSRPRSSKRGQLAGYHQLVLNYAATSRATTKFSLSSQGVNIMFEELTIDLKKANTTNPNANTNGIGIYMRQPLAALPGAPSADAKSGIVGK